MLWSKRSSIINSLVIVALFFTLWISITVCNPIRKHQQHLQRHSNSIIHAKVGEVINISCWFDPNLLAARMRQQQQQNFDLYDHYKSKKSARRANRHKTSPSNLFPSGNSYNDQDEDEKEEWEEGREETENNWPQLQPQSPLSKIVNKVYELDWYFWDKNGKFKIISYGNLTASDYKYKTFVNREDLMNAAAIRSSQNLPQSSALYSQTSSRSSPNSNNVFTYYLSALIESDQDEGVYQCINPDSPNFILRNVTVLIANNGASKHFQSFIFILSINLTYLVFQLIN